MNDTVQQTSAKNHPAHLNLARSYTMLHGKKTVSWAAGSREEDENLPCIAGQGGRQAQRVLLQDVTDEHSEGQQSVSAEEEELPHVEKVHVHTT